MQSRSVLAAVLLIALNAGGGPAVAEQAEQLARRALTLEGTAAHGAKLFGANCASCHGPTAGGDAAQLVPALAGQRRAYLIKQLADFSAGAGVSTAMHSVALSTELADPQTWADVALYLNTLPPLTGRDIAVARLLTMGQESYRQRCASCHEEDARGAEEGVVPALRNQHYEYLLRELRGITATHRFDMDAQTRRSLTSLKGEELTAIAHYLSRLRAPMHEGAPQNERR